MADGIVTLSSTLIFTTSSLSLPLSLYLYSVLSRDFSLLLGRPSKLELWMGKFQRLCWAREASGGCSSGGSIGHRGKHLFSRGTLGQSIFLVIM